MEQSRRSRIPKFGSWDSSDGNAPYTEVFEDARAARLGLGVDTSSPEVLAGRLRDPHPQKVNPTDYIGARRPPQGRKASREETEVSHGRKTSRDDGEEHAEVSVRRQTGSHAYPIQIDDSRYVPQTGPRQVGHSQSSNESGTGGRLEGFNGAAHRSPMHRNGTRIASPAWEKRGTAEGSSTPGRSSRLRTTGHNMDTSDNAALPKFGAWDANDPASADGFTVIFNNARNEKKAGGSIHIPPLGFDKDLYPERTSTAQSKASTRKFLCCFQPAGVEA